MRIKREHFTQFPDLGTGPFNFLLIAAFQYYPVHPRCNLFHMMFFEAAAGYCRGSYPDATGDKTALGVKWNGVLIDCQACALQNLFGFLAGNILIAQVHEQ